MEAQDEIRDYLRKALLREGISLPERKAAALANYSQTALAANEQMNLTACRSWKQMVDRHIMDCILGIRKVEWKGIEKALDLGAGAGLPGIPLAIIEPQVRVCLVEASGKKAGFLLKCVKLLELNNVEVKMGRAEDIGREPQYREKMEVVTARGVAPLAVLLEYCLPFLANDGLLLAWKGPSLEEELMEARDAVEELKGEIECIHDYRLVDGRDRKLLLVRKKGDIPQKYPRRSGMVKKRPLGGHFIPKSEPAGRK